MKPALRWFRFNLVGAAGMAVQLGTLAVLNRVMPGHYLAATAMALEITLLHNFAWHVVYTWRDRRSRWALGGRLLRFHLTNGLVSYAGNFLLMRVLVGSAHMPLLMANAIAILCCSILNFLLADRWAFMVPSGNPAATEQPNPVT